MSITADTMLRAARLLEQDAAELKQSHTVDNSTWILTDPCDRAAKADHDERLAIASKLMLLVEIYSDPARRKPA